MNMALLAMTADTAQTQDLVTLVPWTFIIQIINLFIQIFLIKKFLFGPVNEILEKRRPQRTNLRIRITHR